MVPRGWIFRPCHSKLRTSGDKWLPLHHLTCVSAKMLCLNTSPYFSWEITLFLWHWLWLHRMVDGLFNWKVSAGKGQQGFFWCPLLLYRLSSGLCSFTPFIYFIHQWLSQPVSTASYFKVCWRLSHPVSSQQWWPWSRASGQGLHWLVWVLLFKYKCLKDEGDVHRF